MLRRLRQIVAILCATIRPSELVSRCVTSPSRILVPVHVPPYRREMSGRLKPDNCREEVSVRDYEESAPAQDGELGE